MQDLTQAFGDIPAAQRFAERFLGACRAAARTLIRAAVAARQPYRNVGSGRPDLLRELFTGKVGQRLIPEDDVEALWRRAKGRRHS